MNQGWFLGGRRYAGVRELGKASGGTCAWHLVHGEEQAWLLQVWMPRPPDRELDRLREMHLQGFLDTHACDPTETHFGYDDGKAWLLQALRGTSLATLWPEWTQDARMACFQHIRKMLMKSAAPRLLHPDVIMFLPGRILLPRVLGEAPWGTADLQAVLADLEGPGISDNAMWEDAPLLGDDIARPLQGRSQEMTFLKTIALGFTASVPMERVVVLSGEDALDQTLLARWTSAIAETEGLWTTQMEINQEDQPGTFIARLLQELIQGFEADLYTRSPETARVLARRLESFGFLRSGKRSASDETRLGADEIAAAIWVLAFAQELHGRMVLLTGLEKACTELQRVLAELVQRSSLPWLLSASAPSHATLPKTLLGPLKGNPNIAFVTLQRLDDSDIRAVINSILITHQLPDTYIAALCRESLGNPGLLHGILEMAQLQGSLVWSRGQWTLSSDTQAPPSVQQDLVTGILTGRLHRLGTAGLMIVRILSMVDHPLDLTILGRVLGLAGDPLEDAIRPTVTARVVALKDGRASLVDSRVRDIAIAGTPAAEVRRLARALLKAIGEASGRPVLSVRLQSLAENRATALAQVLEATEQEPPVPSEAQQVVQQALALQPTPLQQARLWEFLSDAWSRATLGGRMPAEDAAHRSPYSHALEAITLAQSALQESVEAPETCEHMARVLRKRAFLEIHLRELTKAHGSIQSAAECLHEHPRHPEQIRLRLALGRVHILSGYHVKGQKALEEALQMLKEVEGPPDMRDQIHLLVELGRAQAQRSQFQRALATFKNAQLLLEKDQDFGRLAVVLESQAKGHFAIGQTDMAYTQLRDALHAARIQDDQELLARCHLDVAAFRNQEQSLDQALQHIQKATDAFARAGDRAGMSNARVWRARTLAALGDSMQAEMGMIQALSVPPDHLTAEEKGDHAYLQGEIAAFRDAWRDASRLFGAAVQTFETAGMLWRERLARLRRLQADVSIAIAEGSGGLEHAWACLESLKTLAEGSGSRWLELEWHRAHAMLLGAPSNPLGNLAMQGLSAWGQVLAGARELRWPALTLEASAASARILLLSGEKMGACSRLQDAFSAFQELWSHVPEAHEASFLARPDIHRFRETVESAGLSFALPARMDPTSDWTPTLANLQPLRQD